MIYVGTQTSSGKPKIVFLTLPIVCAELIVFWIPLGCVWNFGFPYVSACREVTVKASCGTGDELNYRHCISVRFEQCTMQGRQTCKLSYAETPTNPHSVFFGENCFLVITHFQQCLP